MKTEPMKAYLIKNDLGEFIGLAENEGHAIVAWGTAATYTLLTWEELADITRAGGRPVFIAPQEDQKKVLP